jgi:zinc transport system ATP-binding protein
VSKEITSPTSAQLLRASKPLILDVDDLRFNYGADEVLSDISFCVHESDFIGLIGSNGAGKTTLLEIILGLKKPTSGTVKLGKNVTIGYVPQQRNQYSGAVPISVLEVVTLGSKGDKNIARKALAEVDMAEYQSKRFKELSGGQQQRVFIAKALASQAKLLILDEPATGIDERAQEEFYAILRRLQKLGMTIMMVSHELDVVKKLVNRVMCINGTIVFDGEPQDFNPDEYLSTDYKQKHIMLHHGGKK